jgi:hypothetical protein
MAAPPFSGPRSPSGIRALTDSLVNTAWVRRLCGNGKWGLRTGATTIDLNDV